MSKGRVVVTHRELPRCKICPSKDTVYTISYWDQDNRVERTSAGVPVPNVSERACKDHLVEVTCIVYKKAGLLPDSPKVEIVCDTAANTKV